MIIYLVRCFSLGKCLSNKVFSFQSPEAKASGQMEKQGLIKGLTRLKEKGVTVLSLTTDRHPAIKKHMRTEEPQIKHYFDVWHTVKGKGP